MPRYIIFDSRYSLPLEAVEQWSQSATLQRGRQRSLRMGDFAPCRFAAAALGDAGWKANRQDRDFTTIADDPQRLRADSTPSHNTPIFNGLRFVRAISAAEPRPTLAYVCKGSNQA